MTPEQKKSNVRLGLILASVAAVFFLGFVAKFVLFNGWKGRSRLWVCARKTSRSWASSA